MLFSKSCEYAMRSVLYLAVNNSSGRVGLKEMADELDIPNHFLGKIMQTLVRHNIVSSSKGRNGGFYLTDDEINAPLMRVVDVMDGTDAFDKCALGLSSCSKTHPCPLHNHVVAYRDVLQKVLAESSLKEFSVQINEEHLSLFR